MGKVGRIRVGGVADSAYGGLENKMYSTPALIPAFSRKEKENRSPAPGTLCIGGWQMRAVQSEYGRRVFPLRGESVRVREVVKLIFEALGKPESLETLSAPADPGGFPGPGLRGLRFWSRSCAGRRVSSFLEKIIQHTQISIEGIAGIGTKIPLELS